MTTGWYVLTGLAVLVWLGVVALSIRSERARKSREARMTPEQREQQRREIEASTRGAPSGYAPVNPGGFVAAGGVGAGDGCGDGGGCG
jgi:hypothetical protein